jgi:hypothetical protein
MTLCGVLKDILLVVASMMIWNTPVTALQFFGYSIALLGLVWYKLGGDKMREYTSSAGRAWAEYGQARPAQRKFVVFGASALIFFLFVGSMAPSYAPQSVDRVKGMLGGATAGNA